MDLSAPKIRTELDSSDFSIRGYKPDVTAPDMNVDFHKGKVKGPNFKKHHVDVKAPDFDIDAPYSKMKLSGNMPEGGDLKFSYPKMNLNPPQIKGGIDSPDFHGLGSDVDFGTYTQMHANRFSVPRGETKAAKTYGLDAPSRDVRIPTHQKYSAPEFNMQDPYYDLKKRHESFSKSSGAYNAKTCLWSVQNLCSRSKIFRCLLQWYVWGIQVRKS